MQGTTADKIREEAMRKAQEQQARSQQEIPNDRQTKPNDEAPSNVLEGLAKLVAPKLQEAFNNALNGELLSGYQRYIGNQVNNIKPQEENTESNSVIDVFVSSQVNTYGTNNVRVFSSSSVSASLPSASFSDGQTTNGNGKGFTSKN